MDTALDAMLNIGYTPRRLPSLKAALRKTIIEAPSQRAAVHRTSRDLLLSGGARRKFNLPEDAFGLALMLGVLYHLKNPYYVLEALAWRARYCLLSTRIKQRSPKGASMKEESLAYFLAPRETNDDPTNYWIFSETALRRLLERTGWEICDCITTGVTRDSEPARMDRGERVFACSKAAIAHATPIKRPVNTILVMGRYVLTDPASAVAALSPPRAPNAF